MYWTSGKERVRDRAKVTMTDGHFSEDTLLVTENSLENIASFNHLLEWEANKKLTLKVNIYEGNNRAPQTVHF